MNIKPGTRYLPNARGASSKSEAFRRLALLSTVLLGACGPKKLSTFDELAGELGRRYGVVAQKNLGERVVIIFSDRHDAKAERENLQRIAFVKEVFGLDILALENFFSEKGEETWANVVQAVCKITGQQQSLQERYYLELGKAGEFLPLESVENNLVSQLAVDLMKVFNEMVNTFQLQPKARLLARQNDRVLPSIQKIVDTTRHLEAYPLPIKTFAIPNPVKEPNGEVYLTARDLPYLKEQLIASIRLFWEYGIAGRSAIAADRIVDTFRLGQVKRMGLVMGHLHTQTSANFGIVTAQGAEPIQDILARHGIGYIVIQPPKE